MIIMNDDGNGINDGGGGDNDGNIVCEQHLLIQENFIYDRYVVDFAIIIIPIDALAPACDWTYMYFPLPDFTLIFPPVNLNLALFRALLYSTNLPALKRI
jgi:hypothetical protein